MLSQTSWLATVLWQSLYRHLEPQASALSSFYMQA